jgi:hypothetical protein
MKNFPLILFFVLSFAFAVFAQTNQPASCPTVKVSGGGVVEPGQPRNFTAAIKGYDSSKLSFNWTVSVGEILEGQGTSSIKVLKKNDNEPTTAVVEVMGGPEGCPALNGAETETIICILTPRSVLVDEFSIPAAQVDKPKLHFFATELGNKPGAQGFIIEYFNRGTSKKIVERKIRKINDYFDQIKIDKTRFTILTAESEIEKNRTKFWIVPPGADNPRP